MYSLPWASAVLQKPQNCLRWQGKGGERHLSGSTTDWKSKASHEQKERMKAPSEGLERGTGRLQLNGTASSAGRLREGTDSLWKCGNSFSNPS